MSLRMKHMRQHLNMGASLQEFQNLMKLQVDDAKAHVIIPIVQQRIEIYHAKGYNMMHRRTPHLDAFFSFTFMVVP